MKLARFIGYKFFKEEEDKNKMIRLVGVVDHFSGEPKKVKILDYDTSEVVVKPVEFLKDYTPLTPHGIFTSAVVNVMDEKGKLHNDVICTISKYDLIKLGITSIPYAVCRQSITDVFNNVIANSEEDMLVGLAINQDDCPANFDYKIMLATNQIVYSEFINFYRMDTIDDILSMINTKRYDQVLRELFLDHVRHVGKPELTFKDEHGGWCRSIKTLLKQNNFMSDINQMLGVIDVDFTLKDYMAKKKSVKGDIEYDVLTDDLAAWLSSTFKVNIDEASVIEYGHDIDLTDFNNNRYFIIRDKNNLLYLVVYTITGEKFEKDYEELAEQYDFSTKFKLNFYNKYNKDNK